MQLLMQAVERLRKLKNEVHTVFVLPRLRDVLITL